MHARWIIAAGLAGWLGAFVMQPVDAVAQTRGELKLEAQLVWGTEDAQSPDPKHRPVEREVARKLKSLPFKWPHYFEVNRRSVSVPDQAETTTRMSRDCEIKVKNLGRETVEVTLIGKGEPVGKVTQKLPRGQLLVLGGNAENFTSWFVVIKQTP